MKPLPLRLRTTSFFLLLALATLASGCVYIRLLQFKNQLADFEKHFSADSTDGIRINCKDPLLLGEDLRWLGAEPESILHRPLGDLWTIRWTKELPRGSVETGVYDIEVQAELAEKKLKSIHIPERYFAFVSKDLFLSALRSAGHAKIDRLSRQAVMDTSALGPDNSPPPIDLGSIEKMLGLPTERTDEQGSIRYRYVFRPRTPAGSGKPIEVIFLFNPKSGNLRRLVGKLPKGTLNFDFADSSELKK